MDFNFNGLTLETSVLGLGNCMSAQKLSHTVNPQKSLGNNDTTTKVCNRYNMLSMC